MTTSKIFLCISVFLLINSVKSSRLIGSECSLKTNEKGVCVNYKNCKSLIDKLKNHEIEFKDVVMCDAFGIVCCPSNKPINPTLSAPPTHVAPPRFKQRISDESN